MAKGTKAPGKPVLVPKSVRGNTPEAALVSRRGVTMSIVMNSRAGKKRKAGGGAQGEKEERPKKARGGGDAGAAGALEAASGGGEKAWRVGHDAVKGRVLLAARDLREGDIVLEEEPMVCASSYEEACIACRAEHPSPSCPAAQEALGKQLCAKLPQIEEKMTDLEAIELELDRVRTFLLLLRRVAGEGGEGVMREVGKCTAHNMEDCLEAVAEMRGDKAMKLALPPNVSQKDAATVLSVLNTNSHELPECEGSGLYPLALHMEHDCRPNCSFTTHGTKLWVTVIEAVKQGQPLSIDYGEAVFVPAAERIAHLEQNYGFTCTCRSCTVLPDRCRAFSCPKKGCPGPVCPGGGGGAWECGACGGALKEKDRREREREEEEVLGMEEGWGSVEEVDGGLKRGLLHRTHHEVFETLQSIAEDMSSSSLDVMSGRADKVWRRVVEAAEDVLQTWHSKKCVFYDNLAQVLVARGDVAGAKKAFKAAWEVSRRCSGESTPPTLALKRLWTHPPKTTEELQATYAARGKGFGNLG